MAKTLRSLCSNVKLILNGPPRLPESEWSDWQRKSNGYSLTLTYRGRRFTFDFWQGTGITHDPKVVDCMECLLSDAEAGKQTFEEWCGNLGYDTDSRKAEAIYRQCKSVIYRGMKRLLGVDYAIFQESER